MAFRVESAEADFSSLLPSLKVVPELLSVYGAVKLFVNGTIDECEVELFGYPEENPEFWVVYKNNKFGKPFVLIGTTSDKEDMYKDAVNSIFPLFEKSLKTKESFEVVTRKAIMDHVRTFLETFDFPLFTTLDEPNYMFFINEQNCQNLLKTQIDLPQGFEFISLNEDDAQVLIDTMPYASATDLLMVKSRLATMPAIGVRHSASGKVAAFECNDGCGFMSHLYTFPEFRRLGLGAAVEKRLCQLNYEKLGILPYKGVSLNRPMVMGMSEASPWWEYHLNASGDPALVYYVIFSKENSGKIHIFDFQ